MTDNHWALPTTHRPKFAVIDCETTGLGRLDRVLEVAVVIVDPQSGEIVNEYDTLINPMRDPGPVGIHGITPSMVQLAPTFDEIAAAVARQIEGNILVAHNLSFDARMLRAEFDRLAATLDAGRGVCTLRLTGERLNLACQRYGVQLTHHHRALADARATAQLLIRVLDGDRDTAMARVSGLGLEYAPRTHRRDSNLDVSPGSVLERLISGAPYPTSDEALLCYLDSLDWVLDDLIITDAERSYLASLADELGLDAQRVSDAHTAYLDVMIRAAARDSVITTEEHLMLRHVAGLLGVSDLTIPDVTELPELAGIPSGATICFTGTMSQSRDVLEALAVRMGLRPLDAVTKRLQVLVAADPTSQSTKTRKARDYGIPVISEGEFLAQFG